MAATVSKFRTRSFTVLQMLEVGLTEREQRLIGQTFSRHPEIARAQVFGSRANGNHRPYSDIDLVLWGQISVQSLATILGELDELPLPYTFDLTVYESIRNPKLKEHIERVGKTIYHQGNQ